MRMCSLLLLIPFLAGCFSPRPEDVPGNIKAQNIDEIAAEAEGKTAQTQYRALGITPRASYEEPMSATVAMPRSFTFYMPERFSEDNTMWRQGTYAHVFLDDTPMWAALVSRSERFVPLRDGDIAKAADDTVIIGTSRQFMLGFTRMRQNYKLPYILSKVAVRTTGATNTNSSTSGPAGRPESSTLVVPPPARVNDNITVTP